MIEPTDKLQHLTTVLWFLYGAMKDNAMYQSHTGRKAFDAACRMLNMDPAIVEAEFDRQWESQQ